MQILAKFPQQYWSSSQGEKHRSGNRYSGTAPLYIRQKTLYDI